VDSLTGDAQRILVPIQVKLKVGRWLLFKKSKGRE
jgi:hypothetical protein